MRNRFFVFQLEKLWITHFMGLSNCEWFEILAKFAWKQNLHNYLCGWVCQHVREVFQCTPCPPPPCPIPVPLSCCHSATIVYPMQVFAAFVSLTSTDPKWDRLLSVHDLWPLRAWDLLSSTLEAFCKWEIQKKKGSKAIPSAHLWSSVSLELHGLKQWV